MTDKRKHLIYWSIAATAVMTFVVVMKVIQKPPKVEPPAVTEVAPSLIKPLPVVEPIAQSVPPETPDPDFQDKPHNCPATIPIPEALDAVKRANPGATLVCYDSESTEFFVHFPDRQDDDVMGGWYRISYPELHKSANGTYWADDRPPEDYTRFFPNVKGLPCKK
jgi:hypothetical protein